jgi:hypothetical protein
MDFATELAAFDPSPELLFWMETRVGGLVEQARLSATEIHWRDAKIEKLTLELAHLRRMRFAMNPRIRPVASVAKIRYRSARTSPRSSASSRPNSSSRSTFTPSMSAAPAKP